MKKLTLDLDALDVTSFPTAAPQTDRGTVDGHVLTPRCIDDSRQCTEANDCAVTSDINSCWCSEYYTCDPD